MPGGTVVFIFPVLSTTDEPLRTSELVIDELQAFGYHQVHLSPTGKSLIYGRPDALVQREITLFLKQ